MVRRSLCVGPFNRRCDKVANSGHIYCCREQDIELRAAHCPTWSSIDLNRCQGEINLLLHHHLPLSHAATTTP